MVKPVERPCLQRENSLLPATHQPFIWLLFLLGLPHLAGAILFYSTGDPAHNTTAPTGALTNSGWQFQGTWGAYLGTPLASKYFITAAHVGGSVGDQFSFRGVNYTTTAMFDDPNSDLRLWRICGTFPEYALPYSRSNEKSKPVVVFGRGTQRGAEVLVSDGLSTTLKGWMWGAADGVQRWGTNLVTAIVQGNLLNCSFDVSGGADEAHLSVGDSGGGVFMRDGTVWKLAGLNLGVDGPYNTSTNGSGFFAAIFDEGGLYTLVSTNWVLTPDLPVDVPGGFYATRISTSMSWIDGVLQGPANDPPPSLLSASSLHGPYVDTPGAVVDPNAKSVTVPAPPDSRFYRLKACDLLRITGISVAGPSLVLNYE